MQVRDPSVPVRAFSLRERRRVEPVVRTDTLIMHPPSAVLPTLPSPPNSCSLSAKTPTKKARNRAPPPLSFKDRIAVPASVSRVYGLVQKATGSVGGNGAFT